MRDQTRLEQGARAAPLRLPAAVLFTADALRMAFRDGSAVGSTEGAALDPVLTAGGVAREPAPLLARPAAVLVALLVDAARPPAVLLTKRTAHLRAHAGQISFPGGRIEPADRDATAAALREAEEEVGLPSAEVEVIGRLPALLTGTGFRIEPVVGLVARSVPLTPDPAEVEEAFELPLSALFPAERIERRALTWEGADRISWIVPHQRHLIWGATAAILVGLAHRLAPHRLEVDPCDVS